MAMINTFTNNPINEVFTTLEYNTNTLRLTPYDQPYFAIRSESEKANDPLDQNGFEDPFKKLEPQAGQFAELENPNNDPYITAELNFLKMLDLVVQRGPKFYIHKNAQEFYKQDGLFDPNNKDTTKFKNILKKYTLPGRFWRNYYWRLYLPDNIKLSLRLDDEMIQIEEEYLQLAED